MTRQRLPQRRPSVTREILWARDSGTHEFTITVGFDPATGAPREVFAGGKTGSDMAAVIADACVLVSLALQLGGSPRALGRSLLKLPSARGDPDGHASPIGAIVAALAAETSEDSP